MTDESKLDFATRVADESLEVFAEISGVANKDLSQARGVRFPAADALPPKAMESVDKIRHAAQTSNTILEREPAIARVAVVDEDGNRQTYFISRVAPPISKTANRQFASYRSYVGRLAELDVGEECEIIVDGEDLVANVDEKATFRPIYADDHWDAKNSTLSSSRFSLFSVRSFFDLLLYKRQSQLEAEPLDEETSKISDESGMSEGIRREAIQSAELRDQPILDRYQGEIFRYPLDSCLMIAGDPGTGKTTTLIRRLGQKLDQDHLLEDEKRIVSNIEGVEHKKSWIMFTPTKLLTLYVKEAFNKEDIPASDVKIKTWEDTRRDLARGVFGIVKSGGSSSTFHFKGSIDILKRNARTIKTIDWFEDFDEWQKVTFWNEIRRAAVTLAESGYPEARDMSAKIQNILPNEGAAGSERIVANLLSLSDEIRGIVAGMKGETDRKIHGTWNLQVNKDPDFLNEFTAKVAEIGEDEDDQDEIDVEEDQESQTTQSSRIGDVANRYAQVMRSLSRARARKRQVRPKSPTGQLIEWLGDRTLNLNDQQSVGESLITQSNLRICARPVSRYVNRITGRYGAFRRIRQKEGLWYKTKAKLERRLDPLEVDIVLLSMMKAADQVISAASSSSEVEQMSAVVQGMNELYRTQVVVDEATDFSPVQLACMATMARPLTSRRKRSFFACGDFNQRVTGHGSKSIKEMRWAVPGIELKEIHVAYRQTKLLNDFARSIASLSDPHSTTSVPHEYVDNLGVSPIILENAHDIEEISCWLAKGICEIENDLGKLPSIAVLVNSDQEADEIEKCLNDTDDIIENSIDVKACRDAMLENESVVRVFDVRHIKGLEFEAAFFVDVDKLAKQEPDVFEKYLYVGATRAARYLGLTCREKLPAKIEGLRPLLKKSWG